MVRSADDVARDRTRRLHRARQRRVILVQIPFLIVMAVVAVAVFFVVIDRWRRGAIVFGSAALAAAVLRAVLPTTRAGLLQVRGRVFDVTLMAAAGAAILWLASSIDALGTD